MHGLVFIIDNLFGKHEHRPLGYVETDAKQRDIHPVEGASFV